MRLREAKSRRRCESGEKREPEDAQALAGVDEQRASSEVRPQDQVAQLRVVQDHSPQPLGRHGNNLSR